MTWHLKTTAQGIYYKIPKAEIDRFLDAAELYAKMTDGTYQLCRRNGATKHWVKSPERIYIPIKHGFKGYGQITEAHLVDGCLHPDYFRHVSDLRRSR